MKVVEVICLIGFAVFAMVFVLDQRIFNETPEQQQVPEVVVQCPDCNCALLPEEPADVAKLRAEISELKKTLWEMESLYMHESLERFVCETWADFLTLRMEEQGCVIDYPKETKR